MQATGIESMTRTAVTATRDLDRLRETAREVVGSVFFGTLLKAMRESGLKGAYGHGGRGEEIFSAQLHGVLAERMGATMRGGLGDAIYRALEGQQNRLGRMRAEA